MRTFEVKGPELVAEVPAWQPTQLRVLYVQVAEHIAARINAGDLRPGQRLAPEREVAREYGVAYSTVRSAMRVLRGQGLIVTIHGGGNYVNDPPPTSQ